MPPDESKPKSAAAGYAQNRRNCGQAVMLDLHKIIPGEFWDQTLTSADYSGEGRAMMAAKAYITALKVSEPEMFLFLLSPTEQYLHISNLLGYRQ